MPTRSPRIAARRRHRQAKASRILAAKLAAPRVVWLMLPAGKITDDAVTELRSVLQSGDIVIDGGNSFYKDDVRRAMELKEKGIHYVDVGTSGGIWGLDRGYCLMIGGEKDIVDSPRSDLLRARSRRRRHPAHRRGAMAAIRGRNAATCIAARTAPGISSR